MQRTLFTPRLAERLGHLCGATVAIMAVVGTAAAQQSFFEVACDAGVGKAFTFILAAATVFVIAKGLIQTVIGADRSRSRGSTTHKKEGREAMKNGMLTILGGIFIPPLAIGVINTMGVSLECLSPGLLV